MGTVDTGSMLSRSPFQVTSEPSAATSTFPTRPWRTSMLDRIVRQSRTGTIRRATGEVPSATAAALENRTARSAGTAPSAPNCGPSTSGSAESMLALGSPVAPQAGKPAFNTSCGFAANKAGRHRTMSARCPTARRPTSWAMPCTSAGLMVILAR